MAAATVAHRIRRQPQGAAPAGPEVHLVVGACISLLMGCTGVVEGSRPAGKDPAKPPSPGESGPGSGAATQPPGSSGAVHPVVPGQPATGQRLTDRQLLNVLADLFALDLAGETDGLPLDPKIEGFRNAASALLPSDVRIEGYAHLASVAVARVDWPARLAADGLCADFSPACRRGFIETWGLRLFRRPVTDAQIERFSPLFEVVAQAGDPFPRAAALVAEAMLQSPELLYRLEADPAAPDPFELASRLSFLVWNSAPDDALLAAAAADSSAAGAQAAGSGGAAAAPRVVGALDRLVADPRARRGLRDYVDDWLDADKLPRTGRDPERFPAFSAALAGQMREEIHRLFDRVVWQDQAPLAEVLTADRTEVTPALAAVYGAPAAGTGEGLIELGLGSIPGRLGLLTLPGILTVTSVGGMGSSIVDRGVFVAHSLLCTSIPEPPNNTPELPVADQGGSERDRLAQHRRDPACAACHDIIDPLGLPFETFDAIGALQLEDEAGNPLTGAGTVVVGGQERPYDNARAFAQILAEDARVSSCLPRKLLQYGFARPLESEDEPLVAGVVSAFEQGGGTYQSLVRAVARLGLVATASP